MTLPPISMGDLRKRVDAALEHKLHERRREFNDRVLRAMDECSSFGNRLSSSLTFAVWRAGEEALAMRFEDLVSTWIEVLRRQGEGKQNADAIRETIASQLAEEQVEIETRIASIQLEKVREPPFSLQEQAARLIRSVDHRLSILSEEVKDTSAAVSLKELEVKLSSLKEGYELAKLGLLKGGMTTAMALIAALATLGSALFAFINKGPGFLSGNQLVAIFVALVAAVIIYFSFVFGRAAKIRAEISKTKKMIEISSGDQVR